MIKRHGKLLAYMLALAVFTTYVVMDTFVISRVYGEASGDGTKTALQIENGEDSAGNTESGAAENAESGNESSHAKGQGGQIGRAHV